MWAGLGNHHLDQKKNQIIQLKKDTYVFLKYVGLLLEHLDLICQAIIDDNHRE